MNGVLLANIFYETLLLQDEYWECECGGKTTILSEICDKCGVEDIDQGHIKK